MTNSQFNFLDMVEADLTIMQQYNAIVAGNVKLSALVTAVKNTHSLILSTAGIQSTINKGPTATKNSLWIDAATKADHVCSGVKAYADDIDDETLLGSMHYTYNSLIKDTTNQSLVDMQAIHDKAATIAIALLAPFNVVASDLTDLQTAITAFAAGAPMKRALVVNVSVATSQLPPLFTLQRKQLKKLDHLVSTFKKSQPTFVESHFNARKIVNLGKGKMAEELHLLPKHFEAVFGMKFETGDTFTIRNHSKYVAEVYLSDVTTALPTVNGVKVPSDTELKLVVGKDFGGVFGHWLMVDNPNALDDVHITVILAHGKSFSGAQPVAYVTA
jgi:hypothetical protein